MLGNRLRVFIKEVLPSHIHYRTNFQGYDRILIISDQVEEYLDILKADMDLDDFGQDRNIGEKKFPCKDEGRSSFDPFPDSYEQQVIDQRSDDSREDESYKKGEEEEDKMDTATVDKEEYSHCGSSTSTSYSASGKVDWDDCECSETLGKNNGFILKEQDEQTPKNCDKDSQENCDVPDFKTLISHWREKEREWIEKSGDRF